LGEWRASANQWPEAADHFDLLLQVNQQDGWDITSLDFLRARVAAAASGESDRTDRICQEAVSRFSAANTNSVAAERILKICLLRAPSEKLADSLAPLARVAKASFATVDSRDQEAAFRAAWGSISLGLWEYRRGNYAESIDWVKRCLASPDSNEPRSATAHIELAMDFFRTSHPEEALNELAKARKSIENSPKGNFDLGSASEGFWFDWAFARILLREANDLFQPSASVDF
jgi:tetratricopeptide (TPR) repeat protein